MAVDLVVVGLAGAICTVGAELTDVIADVKGAIKLATGVSEEEQRLLIGTRRVEDLSRSELLAELRLFCPEAQPGSKVEITLVKRQPSEAEHLRRILYNEMKQEDIQDLSTRDEIIAAIKAGFSPRGLLVESELWASRDFVLEVLGLISRELQQRWCAFPALARWVLIRKARGATVEALVEVLQRASQALRMDRELWALAFSGPWSLDKAAAQALLEELPEELLEDRDFVKWALPLIPWLWDWVPEALREEELLLLEAARAHQWRRHQINCLDISDEPFNLPCQLFFAWPWSALMACMGAQFTAELVFAGEHRSERLDGWWRCRIQLIAARMCLYHSLVAPVLIIGALGLLLCSMNFLSRKLLVLFFDVLAILWRELRPIEGPAINFIVLLRQLLVWLCYVALLRRSYRISYIRKLGQTIAPIGFEKLEELIEGLYCIITCIEVTVSTGVQAMARLRRRLGRCRTAWKVGPGHWAWSDDYLRSSAQGHGPMTV